jgi:hypothetical protein
MIEDKKKNENKHYLCIENNITDNNSPSDIEIKENFIAPEDNNKLSQKQPKAQLNERNGNLFLSKKTTRTKTDQAKFATIQYKENPIKKKRKKHGKHSIDNKITKIKSFIFRIIFLFFNQFFKEKKDRLHQIRGEQANNRTVNFNKKLMKKIIKEILSDTGDDYNKNLYIIKDKKKNENKHYLSIANNTPDNNSHSDIELQENYIGPEDNNKLSQKQPIIQLSTNNENLFISKKTTISKTDQIKFTTKEYEESLSTKKRKTHDKYSIDNIITKVKSFIFRILT